MQSSIFKPWLNIVDVKKKIHFTDNDYMYLLRVTLASIWNYHYKCSSRIAVSILFPPFYSQNLEIASVSVSYKSGVDP